MRRATFGVADLTFACPIFFCSGTQAIAGWQVLGLDYALLYQTMRQNTAQVPAESKWLPVPDVLPFGTQMGAG